MSEVKTSIHSDFDIEDTFKDIAEGSFFYTANGALYLKIVPLKRDTDCAEINAIEIEKGDGDFLFNSTIVIPVKSALMKVKG